MTIEVDLHLEHDPQPTMAILVRGGIRITIDGRRVNMYEDESDPPSIREWYPEFVGEHILLDLGDLFEFVADAITGAIDLFDPRRVFLRETSDAFVCERVGVSHVRIAFQKATGFETNSSLPTPSVACGFAVPVADFATELVVCGEDLRQELDRIGLSDHAEAQTFLEKHANLREAVDSS